MNQYVLNIDWLTIFGSQALGIARDAFFPKPVDKFTEEFAKSGSKQSKRERMKIEGIKFAGSKQWIFGNLILDVQEYGTRQYNVMFHVYYGRELFGFLSAYPRVSTIRPDAFSLKVANMWLYQADFLHVLSYVCGTLHLAPTTISRLDVAADFNVFHDNLHPIEFIRQFMSGEIKHKGRSEGNVNFLQECATAAVGTICKDVLNFNALVLGKRKSDAHCYLYNKTVELQTQHMKPWIVECWQSAGLNVDDVWRLEVSMKSKALKFVDKSTGMLVSFGVNNILHPTEDMSVRKLYFSMLKSLFFFFRPSGQKNVSRERMLVLFDEEVSIERGYLRLSNPSDRGERILIKSLHTISRKYRGITPEEKVLSQALALHLTKSMKLESWYNDHVNSWNKTKMKA